MSEPRRRHPGTVAVQMLRQAPSTLLGLPAFFAIAGGRGLREIALVVLVMAVISAVAAWAQWRAFTYRVDADGLTIADGVFSRSRRTVPRARIQDVSIEQHALQRLFGLALVRLETGGGDKNEGTIDSVSLAEAQRLRDLLRTAEAEAAEVPAEHVLFVMEPGRVILMGLFRFSLVWIAGIYAALQAVDGFIDLDRETVLRWLGVAEQEIRAGRTALLALLALIPVALLLGLVAGVVRTVLAQWGFRVTVADGRFRRRRGLLTRSEVVVAAKRIQLSLVERGLVSRRLGWAGLQFQTLGGSDDPGGRQEMAPFARDAEIAAVAEAAGLPVIGRDALRPVAAGHVPRMLLSYVTVPLVAVLAGSFFAPVALFALPLFAIPVIAALLARRRHRFALADDTLQVTRGVITAREWVVPLENVQAVTVSRSWLQRRLGTATVRVGTAGARGAARPDVVDIEEGGAGALALSLVRPYHSAKLPSL